MNNFITTYEPEKLLSANEANYQSYIRTYATVKENHFQENYKTMLTISSTDGVSMINNCIAKTKMTDSEVIETLQLYKKAGQPVLWTIFPSKQPQNIEKIFKKKRLTHLERNALMYIDMTTLDDSLQEENKFHIKEVDDLRSLKDWTKLNAICFNLTRGIQNFIVNKNADLFLNKTISCRHFIAYYKSKPVGTSSVFLANGVAGIYNVTTAPGARGKGIGEAITKAALIYGKKAGYTFAILQATKMGIPIYNKIGFKSNEYMDYYLKLYGCSRLIIPLNNLIIAVGNIIRRLFPDPFFN